MWFLLGVVVAPIVFALCDEFYVALTNKSLTLQLDPIVIAILGKYDPLSHPLPLYFLVSVAGGILSVFIEVLSFIRVSKAVL